MVRKSIILEDFQKIYVESLVQSFESIITSTDGWDGSIVIQASRLLIECADPWERTHSWHSCYWTSRKMSN